MKKTTLSLVSINIGNPEKKSIYEVFKNNWLTMGPLTEKFEKKFAHFVGSKYAVAVNSCTAALQIAMSQRNLDTDDEIITTPFTWESTTSSILYAGAKPVFADIDPNSGNISADSIKRVATNKTKGILLIHYAGWPADMKNILKLAKNNNWFVIEDCAHALGTKINDRHVGTWGLAGCFSFGSTKTITTGEGGMVVTNDVKVFEDLRVLRNYGSNEDSFTKHKTKERGYDITKLSYNFKINELASALGVAQMDRLPRYIKEKQKVLSWYYQAFDVALKAKILYSQETPNDEVCPLFLPIIIDSKVKTDRTILMDKLKKAGIDSTIHHPMVYDLTAYRQVLGNLKGSCPIAEEISTRILSLPCHGEVTRKDISNVIKIIESFS